MTGFERDVEARLVREVRRAGGQCLKWVGPGWSGVPDRICIFPGGRICFVELKRPKGGKVSSGQSYWIVKLRSLGFRAEVVNTKEQAIELAKEYRAIAHGPEGEEEHDRP